MLLHTSADRFFQEQVWQSESMDKKRGDVSKHLLTKADCKISCKISSCRPLCTDMEKTLGLKVSVFHPLSLAHLLYTYLSYWADDVALLLLSVQHDCDLHEYKAGYC